MVEIKAHFDNSALNVRNPDPKADVAGGVGKGETLEGWIGYSQAR